jgi:hypothetical protein
MSKPPCPMCNGRGDFQCNDGPVDRVRCNVCEGSGGEPEWLFAIRAAAAKEAARRERERCAAVCEARATRWAAHIADPALGKFSDGQHIASVHKREAEDCEAAIRALGDEP